MLTFLIGGARSGKSTHAVRLGRAHAAAGGRVTFVATAPRIDGDAEFDHRIDLHRAERPEHWTTVEEEVDLIGAIDAAGTDLVIVDCLTLWVQNLRWRGLDHTAIEQAAERAATHGASRAAPTVVVSNEVGLGVHPATEDGREFRDQLGRVNQVWARAADRALFFVAGLALELADVELHDAAIRPGKTRA